MKTSDFDYFLPSELIAQEPCKKRENCRMLHLNKKNQTYQDKYFYDVLDLLNKDDILVLNDTKGMFVLLSMKLEQELLKRI